LDERQSDAILEMRLSRLTQLESKELRERLDELERRIVELEAILASPERQLELIRGELREVAAQYSDPRRTRIIENEKSFKLEDMLAAEHVVVTLSREGYVRQIPMAVYQRSMTAGKRIALDRYEDDYVERAFVASTDHTLLLFSSDGRAYGMQVRDVPEAGLTSRGKAVGQLFEMGKKAAVAAVFVVAEFRADRSLVFATAEGTVKRTALDQYANARAAGIEAIKLPASDRVVDVRQTDGESELILVGRGGRAIRFPEAEVPMMGRAAQGVRGIKLKAGESVVGVAVARREGGELCLVTDRGWAKRLPLDELQPQGRGGLGTVLHAPTKETGDIVAARETHPGEDLMATTAGGRTVRVKPDLVPIAGRAGAAEKAVEITGNERLAAVTYVAERELPESPADDEPPPALADGEDVAADATDSAESDASSADEDGDLEAPPAAAEIAGDDAEDAPEQPEASNDDAPQARGEDGEALDLFG
ncbi:MAG TPA: DNA gyrase C-terminal beta-propeller domain-containing protein, partial [Longimicrobium sp.]|nr:DNA gyrase C-terminal beta-propeller domain-containing protein [Longimicrobium sp.]